MRKEEVVEAEEEEKMKTKILCFPVDEEKGRGRREKRRAREKGNAEKCKIHTRAFSARPVACWGLAPAASGKNASKSASQVTVLLLFLAGGVGL